MANQKKSKKTLVHLAISLVVALIVFVITIGLGYMLFTTFIKSAKTEKAKLNTQLEQTQEELERIRKQSQKIGPAKQKRQDISEVRAAIAIPLGTTLTQEMLTVTTVKEGENTPGAMHTIASVIGKISSTNIHVGEPVTSKKIIDGTSIYNDLPKGTRAMTIAVDAVGTLGGQLIQGSFVDVLITVQSDAGAFTRTLLQRVQVIGLGNTDPTPTSKGRATASNKPSGSELVTLAVDPREAEVLALAQNQGIFHLTLRGFEDPSVKDLAGITIGQLASGEALLKDDSAGRIGDLPSLPPDIQRNLSPLLTQNPIGFAESITGVTAGAPNGNLGRTGKFSMEVFKGPNSEIFEFEGG